MLKSWLMTLTKELLLPKMSLRRCLLITGRWSGIMICLFVLQINWRLLALCGAVKYWGLKANLFMMSISMFAHNMTDLVIVLLKLKQKKILRWRKIL
jgi:hypothetical protein